MVQKSLTGKILVSIAILWGVFAAVMMIRKGNSPDLENDQSLMPLTKQEPSTDFNNLVHWANSIESLQLTDEKRNKYLWNEVQNSGDIKHIREAVYRYVNHPKQGVCKVGKYFGGVWIGGYGCLDGHKFVCLDDLYEDVLNNRCLIYSFGINNEWSFEENMISMGCTIRSFDPTIDGSSKPKTDLVTFQKIGLADQPRVDGIGELVTLTEAISRMGDNNRGITYLKVDIEGAELSAMKSWVTSGALDYVSQIGIEVHSTHTQENGNSTLFGLLETFRSFERAGFRLISVNNNECVGKNADYLKQYYVLFELVFYKPRL